MKRVLHIITGLETGGAEHQLLLLVRHLPVHCEVAVLCDAGSVAEAIRAEGVRVHQLDMRGNRDLTALPRLVRLIRRGRYDVVHTHLFRACVFGRLAAWLARTPRIVATEHSLGDNLLEGRKAGLAVQMLYLASERLGAMTIAVSPTVYRRLAAWRVNPRRLAMIPNAIDEQRFGFRPDRRAAVRGRLKIAEDDYVVGIVGRLAAGKRVDLAIEAFAGTRCGTLLIVGDGPERERLQALAGRHGLNGRVMFTGDVADVPSMLDAMDVLVSTSAEETFNLAVLEGAASGLPVLYYACPALEDLPAEMCSGTEKITDDPAEIARALERRRARGQVRLPVPPAAGHYGVPRQVSGLLEIYGAAPAAEPALPSSSNTTKNV
ncbi:glycosyltransferase [Actinocorallia longicatena]|uniref:Glycosyltransferase n=1 Tax=Actinocorallia longicatena TaxID=111803 RepID=A0ABP6QD23_9ACTN